MIGTELGIEGQYAGCCPDPWSRKRPPHPRSLLVQACGVPRSLGGEEVEEGEVDALRESLDQQALDVGSDCRLIQCRVCCSDTGGGCKERARRTHVGRALTSRH